MDEYRQAELVDGQTILLKCSNCRKELAEIWITRPQAPLLSKVRAKCACGDYSFLIDVHGMFNVGEVESRQSRIIDIKTTYEMDENRHITVQHATILTEELT